MIYEWKECPAFEKSKRSRLIGTGMDEDLSDAERKEEELWE